jgi:hypothetical protein
MNAFPGATIEGEGAVSNAPLSAIQESCKRSGLALIRGYDVRAETFRAFTGSLCAEFVTTLNTTREFYGDETLMSVTPGHGHFFAHSELAYFPLRPDLAIFYCVQPALQGGETTVCDGVTVLSQLSNDSRQLLERNKLLFEHELAPAVWRRLAPDRAGLDALFGHLDASVFSYGVEDEVFRSRYVTSAIVPTRWNGLRAFATSLLDTKAPRFADGSMVPREVLWDVIAVTEDLMIPIAWRANDILVVDNSRFMHGRRPWEDDRRQIMVRFGNVAF